MAWERFDDGLTAGCDGPQGGVVLWDARHPRGARVTAELASRFAVVTVTLRLFGRIESVRHFDEIHPAEDWYDRLIGALGAALDQEPLVGDADLRQRAVRASQSLSEALESLTI
jgi:hypothetical protein